MENENFANGKRMWHVEKAASRLYLDHGSGAKVDK